MSIKMFGDSEIDIDKIDTNFHVAASTDQQKISLTELENKYKEMPDKYFLVIAHFLAGHVNDTETFNQFNEPMLKSSVKSFYWVLLVQYAALTILGIVLNIAIISYILYHRLYKDVTHAFIINLAFCHIVQCAFVLPISLMEMLIQNWIFGQFICYFLPMLQDIPLHVALLSHILIAWDRMRWVSDPFNARMPGFVCCCACWLTGMIIALPYPIYTFYVDIGNYVPGLSGIGICILNLMDDMQQYVRGLFFMMYCGPVVLLAYFYIRTSQQLHPSDGPFAVMMFEHRAEMRHRQRNMSTSSGDRSQSAGGTITTATMTASTVATTAPPTITTTTAAAASTTTMTTTTATTAMSAISGMATTTSGIGSGPTSSIGHSSRSSRVGTSSSHGNHFPSATTTSGLALLSLSTNTGTGAGSVGGHSSYGYAYDLYNAELDVYRERRNQRNFGSMAAAHVVCICPLMILRFVRLSMAETYENQKYIDIVFLMFVWMAFLPTVIFPCIYISQMLPRAEQERLRGYFRLGSRRFRKSRQSASSRENSIEKEESTNVTQATTIISNADAAGVDVEGGYSDATTAVCIRNDTKKEKSHQRHNVGALPPYRQGKDKIVTIDGGNAGCDAGTVGISGRGGGGCGDGVGKSSLSKESSRIKKKNDIKINIISDSKSKGVPANGTGGRHLYRNGNAKGGGSSYRKDSASSIAGGSVVSSVIGGVGGGVGTGGQNRLTIDSFDNNSCSNITSSTYCNGNGNSLYDDGGTSNFGDGEDSSIVSGMIVSSGGGTGGGNGNLPAGTYFDKKWTPSMRQKDLSFSDCGSYTHIDSSSSTLERDLEIINLLERERSMDLQDMLEREQLGETVRRRLPDIEKICQRSPKTKLKQYSFDKSQTTASTVSVKDTQDTMTSMLSTTGTVSNEAYSVVSTSSTALNSIEKAEFSSIDAHDKDEEDEEADIPVDFFDKYSSGSTGVGIGGVEQDSTIDSVTPATSYQYQYTRRNGRNVSSHHHNHQHHYHNHGQGSSVGSHRSVSKRDSFNTLNGSDLIAGAFGELDPTQPLTKMSVIENRMRRSSGRTSSFSSSGRSSMKSRDFSHGSSHSTHPELDFRENIFAEL